MSREIKFRVWDKHRNKMVAWYDLLKEEEKGDLAIVLTDTLELEADVIIMQFTGLLDKNGKEIYEGDVVENEYGCMKVIWWLAGFYFKYLDDKGRGDWVDIDSTKCEVIGSIYENPELVKEDGPVGP